MLCRTAKTLCQKSCGTKVSRIFRIFVPNFAPNVAPNFPRIFRGLFVLRFVGDGDQKKFTKNPRHFSMQTFPGKHEKNIHKILLESRQSNKTVMKATPLKLVTPLFCDPERGHIAIWVFIQARLTTGRTATINVAGEHIKKLRYAVHAV